MFHNVSHRVVVEVVIVAESEEEGGRVLLVPQVERAHLSVLHAALTVGLLETTNEGESNLLRDRYKI